MNRLQIPAELLACIGGATHASLLVCGWCWFFCLLCAVRSASSPLRSDFCVVKTDGEWSGPHELRYPIIFTASEEQCAGSCPVLNVAATLGIDRAARCCFYCRCLLPFGWLRVRCSAAFSVRSLIT